MGAESDGDALPEHGVRDPVHEWQGCDVQAHDEQGRLYEQVGAFADGAPAQDYYEA